jgi:UDP-glucose 4-epimerase
VRIAITGAFGYIGGRLADHLAERGNAVVLTARAVPEEARLWASDYDVRIADVLDEVACAAAFSECDAVVHLASLDEREAVRDPARAMVVSGEGTRNVLAAARHAKVRRVVFFSTFHVYGKPDGDVDETTPTNPTHPYALAHLAGEHHVQRCRSDGQSAVSFRVSNGYGAPRWATVDRWTLAHNDFCRQAFQSSTITLATPGTQHRDFVAIEDVAGATALILDQPEHALGEGIFDVGGNLSMSIYGLAERVRETASRHLGRSCTIIRPEPPSPEVGVAVRFSTARLGALGYAPRDRIDEETVRILRLLREASA